MTNVEVPLQYFWLRCFQPLQITPPPKTSTGLNGDAVNQQEKISAAGGAKEGKIKPTLPHLLAVCLHLQLPRCTVSVDENRRA